MQEQQQLIQEFLIPKDFTLTNTMNIFSKNCQLLPMEKIMDW